MTILVLMILSILVPLVIGLPIALALGGSGLFWLVSLNPNLLKGASYALWNTAANYMLISVPLFILMGEIMQRTSLGSRFYAATSRWVGWLPGGLLHSNILACGIFSAVSGSSVATAATIGTNAVPELTRLGYPRGQVFGSLAAGGTLGILIPPSIPLIIYAALTEVSLGKLFLGAFLPGVMMLVAFSLYIFLDAVIRPKKYVKTRERNAEYSLLKSLVDVGPIFVIIVLILAGIYSGYATPTEVAAVGVIAALIIAAARSELTFKIFGDALISTVRFTSMIMFVVIGAQIFAFALFAWGIPREVSGMIAEISSNPTVVLAVIVVMYLVLGMFIDPISIMVLTLAVLFPVITSLGFDPVWFGVVLVLLLEIGLLTPPVGINLYVVLGIAPPGTRLSEVVYGTLPYIGVLLLGVLAMIIFPEIVLWLPNSMN